MVAYSVSQRTREIGVRMALGAHRATVYGLILKEAGWLTGWGIVSGALCSIGAATLMRNMLFGTAAWDIATLSAVAAVLALSALLASFIPAHRAASVNPAGRVASGVTCTIATGNTSTGVAAGFSPRPCGSTLHPS